MIKKVRDMIFKEDQILIPLMLETFGFFEWIQIDKALPEFGYTLIAPPESWAVKPQEKEKETDAKPTSVGEIGFDAGGLTAVELNAILNTIPLDMTFVDKNDNVKYFTRGKERIFDRPLTIIGRNVSMCHPPHSVHIVEKILSDFKSGLKDHEDFWIRMRGEFIHIRYFAIRDVAGEYLGTLELTQNIKPITELQGEKRLVSN
ncbi:MAG: PAS domain-containing protein [Bacillus subtilis]|nr:PAS domain-containing protein [Bacillus subtilis]